MSDHLETIFAISLFYHATKKFTVPVAQCKIKPEYGDSHKLTRFGGMYEFYAKKMSVSPTGAYDLIEHNISLVFSLGYGI